MLTTCHIGLACCMSGHPMNCCGHDTIESFAWQGELCLAGRLEVQLLYIGMAWRVSVGECVCGWVCMWVGGCLSATDSGHLPSFWSLQHLMMPTADLLVAPALTATSSACSMTVLCSLHPHTHPSIHGSSAFRCLCIHTQASVFYSLPHHSHSGTAMAFFSQ